MFFIITYDINEHRVNLVKKILREFLKWEQNSVFSGDLTTSQIRVLMARLERTIDKETDHIIIFKSRSSKFIEREDMGKSKTASEGNSLFI
ncbi:MAG: CRISPR-associated endonuclease Cas2 [Thermoplasmataceae archaeon]